MTTEAFKLEYPIEVDGIETDTLNLRRITIGDLEDLDANKNAKTERQRIIKLLSAISGAPEKSIKQMDAYDFERAVEQVMVFLGVPSQESENS